MNTSTRIRSLLTTGAIGAATAAIVNTAIFGLGRAAGVAFVVTETSTGVERIAVTDVVSFTLMCFAVGVLAAVTARALRRPSLRVVQVVGAVIAVASVVMDVPIDGSPAAKVLLASMHLMTGAAFVAAVEIAQRRSVAAERHPVTTVDRRLQPVAA